MSTLKHDKHSICFNCRSIRCDFDNRCHECKNWSNSQMEEYIKHRKILDNKSPKKTDLGASSSVASETQSSSESLKSFEEKITSKVGNLVSSMIEKLSQDVITNVSIPAPSVVPEC